MAYRMELGGLSPPHQHSCLWIIEFTSATVFDQMNNAPLPSVEQLLVWIPKAKQGPNPDNWRPLAIPPTIIRLLGAITFGTAATHAHKFMHPAQALLADFKEAQGNFVLSQQTLIEAFRNKDTRLHEVLLTDTSKAFERIHPHWIV